MAKNIWFYTILDMKLIRQMFNYVDITVDVI
jgi:hypothetical protein